MTIDIDPDRIDEVPRELLANCLHAFLEGAPTSTWDSLQAQLRAQLLGPHQTRDDALTAAAVLALRVIHRQTEALHPDFQSVVMALEKALEIPARPDPAPEPMTEAEREALSMVRDHGVWSDGDRVTQKGADIFNAVRDERREPDKLPCGHTSRAACGEEA